MRVLMLSKALVTGVYQKKLEELAMFPDFELLAVVPPYWVEGRVGRLELESRFTAGYELVVEPMRFNGHHHLHWYPGLAKQMQRFRPDLVHIDEEPYNWVTAHAMHAANRVGARSIFFAFQNIYRRYPPPFSVIEQRVFDDAAAGIAGNQDALEVLRRKGFRGRGVVIPQFGVDPEIYKPLHPSGAMTDPVIAYYGRLVPEKGIDTLIEAMALLPAETRALIVGSGTARQELEALAARLNVAERVEFRGPIAPELIPQFLTGVSAIVVPSRTRPNWKEQFGRVLVEAMACGVPVVGSDSGEIPNVIGDAGVVFPEGDAHALATALESILGDRERATNFSEAGRARVLANYTQHSIAEATRQLYRQIMAGEG